jgi:DNA-binding transcriptional LysR family regulator
MDPEDLREVISAYQKCVAETVQLGACTAGHGVAQILALGTEDLFSRGKLIELFPDWSEEQFPLYVFHLSRHVPPAKVRAFLDFVVGSVR